MPTSHPRETIDILHEAAPAWLHADTKSLQVLITRCAKFPALARSSTAGLRNSRKHSKQHCNAERPTSNSAYHDVPSSAIEYCQIKADGGPERGGTRFSLFICCSVSRREQWQLELFFQPRPLAPPTIFRLGDAGRRTFLSCRLS